MEDVRAHEDPTVRVQTQPERSDLPKICPTNGQQSYSARNDEAELTEEPETEDSSTLYDDEAFGGIPPCISLQPSFDYDLMTALLNSDSLILGKAKSRTSTLGQTHSFPNHKTSNPTSVSSQSVNGHQSCPVSPGQKDPTHRTVAMKQFKNFQDEPEDTGLMRQLQSPRPKKMQTSKPHIIQSPPRPKRMQSAGPKKMKSTGTKKMPSAGPKKRKKTKTTGGTPKKRKWDKDSRRGKRNMYYDEDLVYEVDPNPILEPRKTDVLCGRGNGVLLWPGNIQYREFCYEVRPDYERAYR